MRTEFFGYKAMGEDEISEHEAMEQDEILEYEDLEEQFEMQGNLDHGTMPEITEKKTGFSYPYGLVNETDLEERRQITWLKFAEDIDEEKEGDEDEENEDEEETKQYIYVREETQLQPFSFQKPLKAGSEDNEMK